MSDDKSKKNSTNGVENGIGKDTKDSINDKGIDSTIVETSKVVQGEQSKRGRGSVKDVSANEIELLQEFRESTTVETEKEVRQIDLKEESEFNFLTGQFLLLIMNSIFPTVLVLIVNLIFNKQVDPATIQLDEAELQSLQASADEYAMYLNAQLGNSPFIFPVTVLIMYIIKLLTTW